MSHGGSVRCPAGHGHIVTQDDGDFISHASMTSTVEGKVCGESLTGSLSFIDQNKSHGQDLLQMELGPTTLSCAWKERRTRTQGGVPNDCHTSWGPDSALGTSHMLSVIVIPVLQGTGSYSQLIDQKSDREVRWIAHGHTGLGLKSSLLLKWMYFPPCYIAFGSLGFRLLPQLDISHG